jgi:galactose-1-phosphate uridylyltransferase
MPVKFEKVVHDGVEYRFDPLTGHQTRINPARARRLMQSATHGGDSTAWIKATQDTCPFCREKLFAATPCFSADFCIEGRIRTGEGHIFPNLSPFSQYHAVATFSSQHFLDVDQFDELMVATSLKGTRDYFRSVHAHDHAARFPVYIWNYLPPSAGSIIHPHVQLMVEQEPVPELKLVLDRAQRYYEATGKNYWDDLAETEESAGERHIGAIGDIRLIASFAPRGFREVTVILPGVSSFNGLDDGRINSLAVCFTRILKCYKSMGVGSFNMVSFSSSPDQSLPYFTLHFKIVSRPYPRNVYTNDSGPFERFYDIWVIDTLPEEVAASCMEYLGM